MQRHTILPTRRVLNYTEVSHNKTMFPASKKSVISHLKTD
jgi:hypothetical protein